MHELSIANALIDQVCEHAASSGAERVAAISIRMGALSGISRALYFCFPSASRGTICEGAILHIHEVPLTVMCTHCEAVKTPAALYNFRCPDCGRPTPKVLTGREMQLVSIELVAPNADDASAPKEHLVASRKQSHELPGSMT
jgi:hydrogenase nickel incorporation protein HypA/HybF